MANAGDLKITFEIEPNVKLQCGCLACRFNIASGDNVMAKDKTIYPEGFCLLKYVIINEDGQCVDKSIVQTGTQGNSDYYNSRQYTCRDGEERCMVTGPAGRCTLPKGHQGKHWSSNDVEFD
jgi:hypothetical protein